MESKLLQTKDIGDFSSVTVRYFGSCTPAAALGACTALQPYCGSGLSGPNFRDILVK